MMMRSANTVGRTTAWVASWIFSSMWARPCSRSPGPCWVGPTGMLSRMPPPPLLWEAPQVVLYYDDAALGNHAEVDGPHGEQVRRHAAQLEVDERDEERERDQDGDDQGGAQVEQEGEQDQRDEHAALEQVVADRVQRRAHQLGAIVEGIDPDALVGESALELGHRRPQALEHRGWILVA